MVCFALLLAMVGFVLPTTAHAQQALPSRPDLSAWNATAADVLRRSPAPNAGSREPTQGVQSASGRDRPAQSGPASAAYAADRARSAFQASRTPERQAEVESWRSSLASGPVQAVPGQAGLWPMPRDELRRFIEANHTPTRLEGKRLFIFVSSSMPEATLRNYYAVADGNPGIGFALRGVIGSGRELRPTLEWIRKQVCPDSKSMTDVRAEDCRRVNIDLDPTLFRRFGIKRVPAVVWLARDDDLAMPEDKLRDEDFLTYYGDVGLDYVIGQFLRARPQDVRLKELALSLDRSYYRHRGRR